MGLAAAMLVDKAFFPLMAGTLVVLFASIAAAGAVDSFAPLGRSPGRRALVHWLPVAVFVIGALLMGRPEIAIGVVFGVSVAMLSTLAGLVSLVAPIGPGPRRAKRLWQFTLAATLLAFVAGLRGYLDWPPSLALLVEGLMLLSLWCDPADADTSAPPSPPTAGAPAAEPAPRFANWGTIAFVVLAAACGTYLAVRGAVRYTNGPARHVSTGALAATAFSLMLAMPVASAGRHVAREGQSWLAMSAGVGVVLLNLCLLLPLIGFAPYLAHQLPSIQRWHPLQLEWPDGPIVLNEFPLAVWRIDVVVLLILSVLHLPVAVGKWNLAREEGFILVIGYGIYLFVVTFAAT